MRIDRNYKSEYEEMFRDFITQAETGYLDEAGLPSYLHRNRLMSFLFWKRIETAVQIAENIKGMSILDFGCGAGVTFRYFADCQCKITACEKEYLDIVRKVSNHFNISCELFADLFEIKDKKFDRIFALDVLEHIDDPDRYINKLVELLDNEGQLVVSGPTENWLYRLGRKMAGFSGDYHVANIFDIEDRIKKNGLKCVLLKQLYPVFSLFRLTKWIKV